MARYFPGSIVFKPTMHIKPVSPGKSIIWSIIDAGFPLVALVYRCFQPFCVICSEKWPITDQNTFTRYA
jgi:hypothetical protein